MQKQLFATNYNFPRMLDMLKENAPEIYNEYVHRRTSKLENRIIELRIEYKETKDESKRQDILEEVTVIKERLDLLMK